MFTLEDITIYDLIYSKSMSYDLIELLKKFKITNFQELESFVSNNRYFYDEEIGRLLKRAYKCLSHANSGKSLSKVYKWSLYENEHLQNLASKTDFETLGIELPYYITSYGGSLTNANLMELSLFDIKYLASKLSLNGNNAIMSVLYGLGPKRLIDFIDKINFYNEQLDRTIDTIPNIETFNGNLFKLNEEEKVAIVKEKFASIFERLFGLSNYFIFGAVNDELARKIIKDYFIFSNDASYSKSDNYVYYHVALPLINVIAHYTTLNELMEGPSDLTLKRFIKK